MSPKESINEQLMEAACLGFTQDVEHCLNHSGCDPLAKSSDGSTALMLAVAQGSEDCVRLLLPVSDPLAQDNDGHSALMWAAMSGHVDCVRLLLPVSEPLAYDKEGWSALMWAAEEGSEACVRLLLPVSDPLAVGQDGQSASQIAKDRGHSGIAGMIDAYVLALNEAALLSTDILPVPSRQIPVIRM